MENSPARPRPPIRERLRATLLAALIAVPAAVCADGDWNGRRIMHEVFARHEQYPYTYERQTMVLMDAAGHREARKLRRFSRAEADGTLKYLLVFDDPMEVRGVALLAIRHPDRTIESSIYLPAFGPVLKRGSGDVRGAQFLGTDFAMEDLTAEIMTDFRYERRPDQAIDGIPCFVVDAFPTDARIEHATGYGLKRHFIRKDIFFVVRTDYFDRRQRLFKRETRHDLRRVDGDMWRADMILMEDERERHKTLVKIDQRVFSRDYVPAELFTREALLANRHVHQPAQAPDSPASGDDAGPPPAPPDS